MFDQIKQMNQMRQQAKIMQQQLAQIITEEERHGIKVKVNGNQEVLNVELPEDKSQLSGEAIKKVMNAAIERSKKDAAKQMQGQMGDLFGMNK
jgi:DNA-binding protein YbaB